MARTVSHTITDEREAAVVAEVDRLNTAIEAFNRRIQAEKDIAVANGTPYHGPEPAELWTFEGLLQARIDERLDQDVRNRIQYVVQDVAQNILSSEPAAQQAMLKDLEKHRRPNPPTPPGPPNRARRK